MSINCMVCQKGCAAEYFTCQRATEWARRSSFGVDEPTWCPKCFRETDCGRGWHGLGCRSMMRGGSLVKTIEKPPLALTVTELELLAGIQIREIGNDAVAAGTPPGTAADTICARLDWIKLKIERLKIILAALDEANGKNGPHQ